MEKKPISKTIKIFYGIGDLGFTLMTNLSSYLWIFFLTNVNKFSLGTIALMTTISSIIAAVTSPIYGGIINSAPAGKHGRYRSWLLKTAPLVILFEAFMWSNIGGAIMAPILCITFGVIGSQSFNFMYVANASLIAVIAGTPEEKAQMSATRGMWNNMSKVMWAYVGTPFVVLMGVLLKNEALGYPAVQFVFCCLCVLGYYAHFKMTEGYEEPGAGKAAAGQNKKVDKDKVTFAQMMSALGQNPHLISMLFMDLIRWLVQFQMMSSAIYFFKYTLNNLALQSTYLLCANLCAIGGAYIMKPMVSKFGTRNTGLIAFFGLAIFLLIGRFVYTNTLLVMICLVVAQLFLGIAYTSIPTLYADAVVYSQWKMGKNAAGFIMGLMNVPLKCSGFIKNLMITGILAASGYDAAIDPAAASITLKSGIANLFIGIPGGLMLVGAIIFMLGYRLTTEKMAQYKEEINQRAAQES